MNTVALVLISIAPLAVGTLKRAGSVSGDGGSGPGGCDGIKHIIGLVASITATSRTHRYLFNTVLPGHNPTSHSLNSNTGFSVHTITNFPTTH